MNARSRPWIILLALAACDGGEARPLGNDGGIDEGGPDAGSGFTCVVDCSECPPSVADRCEDAAAFCEDPNCCQQVEIAFDCSEPPPPVGLCDFDCGRCFSERIRRQCREFDDQCRSAPEGVRPACCGALEQAFEGCEEEDPGTETCFDCSQCPTASDTQACEVGVEGCRGLPPAQQAICCANIPTLFPACDPAGGGVCGFDCSECPGELQPSCEQSQAQCEGQPPIQRLRCCRDVVTAFGGECGSGGGSCDVDCSQCPTPGGQANCETAKNVCEGLPDPGSSDTCCDALEQNLDQICAF